MNTAAPAALPVITASVRWDQGEQFLASGGSGHTVRLDSDRNSNAGAGPMEIVLMGLCACSATDVVIVLTKARQSWSTLEVSATGERAPSPPAVYTKIHMRYVVGGERLERPVVERAVTLSHERYCSVLAMLNRTAIITHEILVEAPVAPPA